MSNNPIQFPKTGEIPIVGQPVTVNSWCAIFSVTCNCEAKTPLLISGLGSIAVCPACRRGVQVLGVQQDVRAQAPPHFNVNIILPSRPGEHGQTEQKPS